MYRFKDVVLKVLAVVMVFLLSTPGISAREMAAVGSNDVAFSNQTVGTTSAPIRVSLTNTTRASLRVSGFSLSAPQFSYAGPSFPLTLAPGQSFAGAVSFTPTAPLQYRAVLVFQQGKSSTSVNLRGLGVSAPSSATVIATSPSIAAQPAGQAVAAGQIATFFVVASGTPTLSYQWSRNGTPISGAVLASYTTPATTASDNGAQFTVTVRNSAGTVTSSPVLLSVISPSPLTISSSSLSFSTVNVGGVSSQSVSLTNSGSASITVSSVSVTGAGFTASGVSYGLILQGGQSANLQVTFAPASVASVIGRVNITTTASNPIIVINLSGTGVQPVFHSVALNWLASSSAVAGYIVFRSTVSGASYIQLNSSPVTTTQFVDSNVQSGQTYYYVVTAVASTGNQSTDSNQATIIIP